MKLTHAVYYSDYVGGVPINYWAFAYYKDGEFWHCSNDVKVESGINKIIRMVKL